MVYLMGRRIACLNLIERLRKCITILVIFNIFHSAVLFAYPNDDPAQDHGPIRSVVSLKPEDIKNHIELTKIWYKGALVNFVAASETLVAKWSLSHLGTREMATSELIHSSRKFLTIFAVSPLEVIEDLTADKLGEYERAKTPVQKHAKLAEVGRVLRESSVACLAISSIPALVSVFIKPVKVAVGFDEKLHLGLSSFYKYASLDMPFRNLCYLQMFFALSTGQSALATKMSAISFFTSALNFAFIQYPDSFGMSDVFQGMAVASAFETTLTLAGYAYAYKTSPVLESFRIFSRNITKGGIWDVWDRGQHLLYKSVFSRVVEMSVIQFLVPGMNGLALFQLSNQIFSPLKLISEAMGKSINRLMRQAPDLESKQDIFIAGIQQHIVFGGLTAIGVVLFSEYAFSFFVGSQAASPELMEGLRSVIVIKAFEHCFSIVNEGYEFGLRSFNKANLTFASKVRSSFLITLPICVLAWYSDCGALGIMAGTLVGTSYNLLLNRNLLEGQLTDRNASGIFSTISSCYAWVSDVFSRTFNYVFRKGKTE